jgi:hypothetical protein
LSSQAILASQNNATPEVSSNNIESCLPSVFENINQKTHPKVKKRYKQCNTYVSEHYDALSADEAFATLMGRIKLSIILSEYEQLYADIQTARKILIDHSDLEGHDRRHKVVKILEFVRDHFENPDANLLPKVREFSDQNPDFLWAHTLYQNIAFTEKQYEDVTLATERRLRIRPDSKGVKNLITILMFNKKFEDARDIILDDVSRGRYNSDRFQKIIMLSKVESALGNYEKVDMILQLLDDELDDGTRRAVRHEVFANLPLLRDQNFPPTINYRLKREVIVEQAINLLNQSQKDAALKRLGDFSLTCRELRCTKLELAVAEAKEDKAAIRRLTRIIENPRNSLSMRSPNGWERALIVNLPIDSSDKYEYSGLATPEFSVVDLSKANSFKVKARVEEPRQAYEFERDIISIAKKHVKSLKEKRFLLVSSQQYMKYRPLGNGKKQFHALDWEYEFLIIPDGSEIVPWRYISAF